MPNEIEIPALVRLELEDLATEYGKTSATQNFIKELIVRAELAEKQSAAFKNEFVEDQARIATMQSLLMRVHERWWPFVHASRSYASEAALNLGKEFTPVINYTKSEAIEVIKAQALTESANNFPVVLRKMWSGGDVKAYLEKQAEVKKQAVAVSVEERLKDVPF